jgi:hypothetical protein
VVRRHGKPNSLCMHVLVSACAAPYLRNACHIPSVVSTHIPRSLDTHKLTRPDVIQLWLLAACVLHAPTTYICSTRAPCTHNFERDTRCDSIQDYWLQGKRIWSWSTIMRDIIHKVNKLGRGMNSITLHSMSPSSYTHTHTHTHCLTRSTQSIEGKHREQDAHKGSTQPG